MVLLLEKHQAALDPGKRQIAFIQKIHLLSSCAPYVLFVVSGVRCVAPVRTGGSAQQEHAADGMEALVRAHVDGPAGGAEPDAGVAVQIDGALHPGQVDTPVHAG